LHLDAEAKKSNGPSFFKRQRVTVITYPLLWTCWISILSSSIWKRPVSDSCSFPILSKMRDLPEMDYWLCTMNFFNMWTNCQIESHWRMVVVAFNNCRTTEAERNDCWSGVSNRNENYISICLLELSSPLIST
jgi:hypothetical protein